MSDLNSPPCLLTVNEVAALLHVRPLTARRIVNRHIIPKGGVVSIGRKYMVHAWAINAYLSEKVVAAKRNRVILTPEQRAHQLEILQRGRVARDARLKEMREHRADAKLKQKELQKAGLLQ